MITLEPVPITSIKYLSFHISHTSFRNHLLPKQIKDFFPHSLKFNERFPKHFNNLPQTFFSKVKNNFFSSLKRRRGKNFATSKQLLNFPSLIYFFHIPSLKIPPHGLMLRNNNGDDD
jgi:hypothetical protein